MQRKSSGLITALGLVTLVGMSAGVFAQQAPAAGRGAAPEGRGGQAAGGRGAAAAAEAATRPPLLFKEEWKQPPYTGQLNDENRRVTQDAVTNSNLTLTLYGGAAKEIGVYTHEGRFDLWSGMATSPVAVTL